jgi:putative hemolysin
MEITFLFGLILLNGVFAMAEIALVTARRTRLQKWPTRDASGGGPDAGHGSHAVHVDHPDRHHLHRRAQRHRRRGGAGRALRDLVAAHWSAQGVSEIGATALVVLSITYFSIVLANCRPSACQINPEPIRAWWPARCRLWR